MALDPVQMSLVILASAVKEARAVLDELDEPALAQGSLGQLRRILQNDAVDVIVDGVNTALLQQIENEGTGDGGSIRCPVCDGEKNLRGAVCLTCRGTGRFP